MSKEIGPHGLPESFFVGHVSETVSEIKNENRIISQHQIEPINLKYSPKVNLRHQSYYVFAIGLILLITFVNSALNNYSVDDLALGNILCLFSFAIAFFMNASYSKGKSDWKLLIGQSSRTSNSGMIFSIILGMLCILIVVFGFILL